MADPGQAATDPQGTTTTAPEGQSASPDQTTAKGPDRVEESFFDPKSIEHDPNLVKAYKQMQSSFSKKMAGIREGKDKIQAYDQAMADPVGTVRQLAAQHNLTVVDGGPEETEFKPNSWEEVVNHISEKIEAQVRKEYAPLLGEVKSLKQQTIEQYLDREYKDWRTYEDEMVETLTAHPSLANDPDKLYRLSVPSEVLEAQATERALAKIKGSADAGSVSGAKSTQVTLDKPKIKTFEDAVKFAKDKLRSQGLTAN